MKIINNNIQKVLKIYNNQNSKKEIKSAARLGKRDELKLSDEAREFQIALKALENTPDVREEKIEEIRQQIQSGTYEIDSKKIAEKMLRNIKIEE